MRFEIIYRLFAALPRNDGITFALDPIYSRYLSLYQRTYLAPQASSLNRELCLFV